MRICMTLFAVVHTLTLQLPWSQPYQKILTWNAEHKKGGAGLFILARGRRGGGPGGMGLRDDSLGPFKC